MVLLFCSDDLDGDDDGVISKAKMKKANAKKKIIDDDEEGDEEFKVACVLYRRCFVCGLTYVSLPLPLSLLPGVELTLSRVV